ncbi:MAG TPA: EAL domain-containing protein [Afifellaceae bacterium]|nr:EAL domain-containing protein [Afifellaceae bacterium]
MLSRIYKFAAMFLAIVMVTGTVLTIVLMVGTHSIRGLLLRESAAQIISWYSGAIRASQGSLGQIIAAIDHPVEVQALRVAQIDSVLVIDGDDQVRPIVGTGNDVADLHAALAKKEVAVGYASPVKAQVYTQDSISWMNPGPFRVWVVLGGDDGGRLAVRNSNLRAPAALMKAFQNNLLYTTGIAVVAFFAFMGGYTYRAERVRDEHEHIRYLALHDELTELPNRKKFESTLNEALEANVECEHKVAVLLFDLDGFKSVNDTLGHPVGDGLLKAAGQRIGGSLRGGDLLARLSGDEFAIVVPKVAEVGNLVPLAERVQALLSKPFRIEGHEIMIGCSMGIAVSPDNGDTIKALLRSADFALYRAKSEGKRTWRFFDPRMAEDMKSRRTLEDGLRVALERNLLTLMYQPQIDLESSAVIGYEALLRWRLPGKGLVPTSIFLSVAEETGLIIPMGEWVIRQALRDCLLLPAEARVAINLSAAQLVRDGVENVIETGLNSYRIDPGRIEIEVNESILGRHEERNFERLEKIRALGVPIVMDNFGVGTSSLGLLTRYPFDKIKIARQFVVGIEDDEKTRAIVAAICNLGRSLGMQVAGEGVETPEHAAILRAAGCSQAQGYHFGHPQSLEELMHSLGGQAPHQVELAKIA